MAATMTTHHAHGAMGSMKLMGTAKAKENGVLATFVGDLIEDLSEPLMQPAALTKHDIFREHINAMTILYFGFIVVLIAASLPVLAYLVTY